MADGYVYVVTSGTFSRYGAKGETETFTKGQTFESTDPDLATRKKNLEPVNQTGVKQHKVVEVQSTTVGAANAAEAERDAAKSLSGKDEAPRAKVKGVTPEPIAQKKPHMAETPVPVITS